MEYPFHFLRLSAATHAAPKGLISRIKWLLDRHSDFAENIEGEDGIEIRRNRAGGVTIYGGIALQSGFLSASLCATPDSEGIACTGGIWTVRYNPITIGAQVFWFGSPEDAPEGSIALGAGLNYGYVETSDGYNAVWGAQGTYPANATTTLRRCIFSVQISAGVSSNFIRRNIGDISA